MRIAMIGAGYVGLVSGACMADFGHHVICVDKDAAKIGALERGEIPIYEPGLQDLVRSNVKEARLSFATALEEPVRAADAVFIAVGTPSRRGDGHADLSYVYDAAREIAAALDGFTVVITKSTVPVGTGDEVERIIREARPDADVAVVSNPEFLREGAAIHDFKHPDRIVVGTQDERAKKVVAEIYRPLSLNQAPILYTTRRTAELIKYAANAFLATKITFINEIADLCEKVGADVQEVARGIGLDNRIGSKFLHAGPGFGGSCFPKDVRALIKTAQDHDVPLRILEAVAAVNDARKRAMARKVSADICRVAPWQNRCRARPHLQAQYRRHARGSLARSDHSPTGHGCAGARIRSGRHESGSSRAQGRDLLRKRLRLRRSRRCARHCHRMGAVPCARSRAPARPDGLSGRCRSPEHLSARGNVIGTALPMPASGDHWRRRLPRTTDRSSEFREPGLYKCRTQEVESLASKGWSGQAAVHEAPAHQQLSLVA